MRAGWFEVKEVGDATWAIDDRGSDIIYFVAGQERCLLIDTGGGGRLARVDRVTLALAVDGSEHPWAP